MQYDLTTLADKINRLSNSIHDLDFDHIEKGWQRLSKKIAKFDRFVMKETKDGWPILDYANPFDPALNQFQRGPDTSTVEGEFLTPSTIRNALEDMLMEEIRNNPNNINLIELMDARLDSVMDELDEDADDEAEENDDEGVITESSAAENEAFVALNQQRENPELRVSNIRFVLEEAATLDGTRETESNDDDYETMDDDTVDEDFLTEILLMEDASMGAEYADDDSGHAGATFHPG